MLCPPSKAFGHPVIEDILDRLRALEGRVLELTREEYDKEKESEKDNQRTD